MSCQLGFICSCFTVFTDCQSLLTDSEQMFFEIISNVEVDEKRDIACFRTIQTMNVM